MNKKVLYAGLKWTIKVAAYTNGNMAIIVKSRYEEETITVNLGTDIGNDSKIQPYMAFLDTNNCPGIERVIVEAGIAEPYMRFGKPVVAKSGFCTYPLFSFNSRLLEEYDPEGTTSYQKEIEDRYFEEEFNAQQKEEEREESIDRTPCDNTIFTDCRECSSNAFCFSGV